jgi:hypothetical protein
MRHRSVVAVCSILLHAIVLLFLMTADLWRPISEWPTPRSAMAFIDEVPRAVHLEDLNLPKEARRSAPGASAHPPSTHTIELAPIVPPSGVTNETGTEGLLGTGPVGLARSS